MGLPYSARGNLKINVTAVDVKDSEDVTETEVEKIDMVGSAEYNAIVKKYTNDKNKLDYQRMNKDFIQFADKSKTIFKLIGEKVKLEKLLLFVLKNRAAFLSDKKEDMTTEQALALLETLDEISTRSAYKELNAHLKKMMAAAKK